MRIEEYIEAAMRTEYPSYEPMKERIQSTQLFRLLHAAVGISGECGEMFQAITSDGLIKDNTNMIEETGDMLWFIANACSALDVEMPTAIINIPPDKLNIVMLVRRLTVAASKVLDEVKRVIFYGKALDEKMLVVLIRNVVYFNYALCIALESNVTSVMEININKLKTRYPDKYSDEKAMNRNLNDERKALEGEE